MIIGYYSIQYIHLRSRSDRPSLATPKASGAVPHHCDSISGERVTYWIYDINQAIAPQEPQKISFRLLSFCILHSPQAGQGGRPRSLGATKGPRRGFFFESRNQPFFGLLTFGIISPVLPEVASFKMVIIPTR